MINAFLTEIDGTRDLEGVLLIGATNDTGAIDPAVTRPGRFDAIVRVPHPGPAASSPITSATRSRRRTASGSSHMLRD